MACCGLYYVVRHWSRMRLERLLAICVFEGFWSEFLLAVMGRDGYWDGIFYWANMEIGLRDD